MSTSRKQIQVKLFLPGNKKFRLETIRAPKGQCFTSSGEDFVLAKVAVELEKNFPGDEYTMVQVGKGKYNFVWAGKKPIDEAELLVGGLRLGEVSVLGSIEEGVRDVSGQK